MTTIVDLTDDTDTLQDAAQTIGRELNRRQVLADAEQQLSALAATVTEALGRQPGDAWVAPAGALDAYAKGDSVTYAGEVWESTVDANVWAPGTAGWRPRPAGDELARWIQPLGAFDAYGLGDRVQHAGKSWTSTHPANVWEPGGLGAEGQWIADDDQPVDPEPPATAEWAAGKTYATGDLAMFGGATYRCVQGHTSQPGWTPVVVPALWEKVA